MTPRTLKRLKPPLDEESVRGLKVGDFVSITGRIFTARDRTYDMILKLFRTGRRMPLDLRGGVVYHCGPLARKMRGTWQVLSAGPTTSARLDHMQVEFVKLTGARALVGKGGVGEDVAKELRRLGCIYLAFTGGAGVLAASAVERVEKVLWQNLGAAEALWVLRVRNFGPLVVAIDLRGGNLYLRKTEDAK
ncbi:MAG: FumA C-terminus/TtdB family hydratase beta subunit [Hadesarchaea archaeon]|nr:FumA C-terminus/TtdB family hydratase beta subunit [Hadesarchaea archaeon]